MLIIQKAREELKKELRQHSTQELINIHIANSIVEKVMGK